MELEVIRLSLGQKNPDHRFLAGAYELDGFFVEPLIRISKSKFDELSVGDIITVPKEVL